MSLLIGLYVKKALEGNADLMHLTNGHISPVVFPEDDFIAAPYVYYSRTGMTESDSKDGVYGDSATVTLDCVGSSYEEMLLLAGMVRAAIRQDIRKRKGDFSDLPFLVTDLSISAGAEDYDPNTCEYLTQLVVEFETEENLLYKDPDAPTDQMNFPLTLPFEMTLQKD